MQIANPLYDTVFKFMLDDDEVAKLFLSALLEREIVALTYNPQEMLRKKVNEMEIADREAVIAQKKLLAEKPFYSILRLDFAATVRLDDGTLKTILIELQKSNSTTDLMRFRRYIGLQLQSAKNTAKDKKGHAQPIPIYPIFFLGEGLPDIKKHGAVEVSRSVRDKFTKEPILTKDNFIENISYDALIICANELQDNEKTALEKMLSIFRKAADFQFDHALIIDETDYPAQFRPIIRRLQKAIETPDVLRLMDDEDDYFMQFVNAEKRIEDLELALTSALSNAERDLKQAEKNIKIAEEAQKRMEEEKKQAEINANAMLVTLVRIGVAENLTAEAIAQKYNLSLAAVLDTMKA